MNLAIANIRKSKSASVSLFIFILVAALLLNIGLMVITQISPFFDKKVEQLKDPHATVTMDQHSYHSSYKDIITSYPGVIDTEIEEIISLPIAKFKFNNNELSNGTVIFNADNERTIGLLTLLEKLDTSSDHDIFLPYSFKTNGGYELGDDFSITYQNKEYEYRIAGFFETTTMGISSIGVMKFMLPETAYQKFFDELDKQEKAIVISALMDDPEQSSKLTNAFMQEVLQSNEGKLDSFWILDVVLEKNISTITVNIIASILVAFAAIIVLVSLIVIRFRVFNSIEDGMANIGILKAIGYTSRQILSSIMLQFISITLCASVVGIILSYTLMPLIGGIISTLTGLIWIQDIDIVINVISVFLVILSVMIVTMLSAFRVRKILPVAALRGGIQTHSFRRNYFPLEHSSAGLHFMLGMKSMLSNTKQNMMILFIIIALTFASVFSAVLYYNVATDKTAFINLFGAEPANVMITANPDEDTKELLHDIEQMSHVSKVNIFDLINTKVDDHTVYTNVTDNYNELENDIVYEGRQPAFDNEISISWVVSDKINKGIGDRVEVAVGNETDSYLVTGLSQSIGNLGQVSALTMDGMKRIQSDYQGSTLNVYLNGVSNKEFIKKVEELLGDRIRETLDIDENIESQTGMYTAAVFAVMLMVVIITVLVVGMILYLVIKTMIIKRYREFGVMKAIGYSTIQLMNQISTSFLPVIIIGVLFGGILGYFFTNPMLSVLLSSAGVKRLDFLIPLPIILMICIGILMLSYIVSMLVSRRIRKISAYNLITE